MCLVKNIVFSIWNWVKSLLGFNVIFGVSGPLVDDVLAFDRENLSFTVIVIGGEISKIAVSSNGYHINTLSARYHPILEQLREEGRLTGPLNCKKCRPNG